MKDTTVEVCTDGSGCRQCGEPTQVVGSQEWAVFTCGYEPIRGNQIKVIQSNNHLAFCEVKVRGESGPFHKLVAQFCVSTIGKREWNIR